MTFDEAVQTVNNISNLSDADRLKLYGLFKLSTIGPNQSAKPGFFNPVGAAKWNAWTEVSHLSQEEAKTAYVTTVQGLLARGKTDQQTSSSGSGFSGVKVSTMSAPEPSLK